MGVGGASTVLAQPTLSLYPTAQCIACYLPFSSISMLWSVRVFRIVRPEQNLRLFDVGVSKCISVDENLRIYIKLPRLDFSGTPGLRPIGYWQTSLGLGSMSQYSAQILIWIPNNYTAED